MTKLTSNDNHTVFEQHSELLSALAHPTRLEIIQLLRGQSLNVTQISTMLGVRQANASQHLALMRENQVVTANKEGKEVYYRVAHENFTHAIDLMREVIHVDLPDHGEPVVVDPICHMQLTPRTAAYYCTYDGVRHYFCGRGCLASFTKDHRRTS